MNTEIIDNYKIDNTVLGHGNFSTVFSGQNIKTGQIVAVKKINISKYKSLDRFKFEIELMQKLSHQNIVTYHDVIKKPDFWYIVLEHCNYGTLEDVIMHNKNSSTDNLDIFFNLEKNTHYYLFQLRDALNYIRKLGYMHRDIKPQNVLLIKYENNSTSVPELDLNLLFTDDENKQSKYHPSQKLIVKLADFGLARHYNETNESMMKTLCGTPYYMAPELLIDNSYNSKADLWSYGVIMYEMLFNKYPVEAMSLPQLKIKMKTLDINFHLGNNFSRSCLDLLIKLLQKDHKKRINWEQFFYHDWFSHWKNLENTCSIEKNLDNSRSIGKNSSDSYNSPLIRTKSNLSRMRLSDYDTNNIIPGTYSKNSNTKNILNQSTSTPSNLNFTRDRNSSSNFESISLSGSFNKYSNSCPPKIANGSGIIKSRTNIIDNYSNTGNIPSQKKSEPITINQPKVSYTRSVMSYITSPISYISGTFSPPNNK